MALHDLPVAAEQLLSRLGEAERDRLLSLWRVARDRQHADILAAVEDILRVVPSVLRGAVRRALL